MSDTKTIITAGFQGPAGPPGPAGGNVEGAVENNLAGFGANSELVDSGLSPNSFATAAQGALADFAVQPVDIDTLAELNAILTDATLIDTGDSRLGDERTPIDNSATNAKLADVATATIKGRVTAGTGDPEDLTAAQVRTLINVEDGATANQTAGEIKTAYETNADTNPFTDAEQTKLGGIEALADVTDTANVAAAGAAMTANNLSDIASAATARTNLAVAPAAVEINAQTGTAYTLALADQSKLITLDNAGAITLTVPDNATVALPVGAVVALQQKGAGQVSVAAAAGVTINSESSKLKLSAQWLGATLTKTATNTWWLTGSIAA